MVELPDEFVKRMRARLGADFENFLKSYEKPPVKGVRVNTLKLSESEFEKISPVKLCGKVGWADGGYYAEGDGLGKTILHAAGAYYVQEPSAMCAAPELQAKAGERVLDLCSAPGGKGTQIAQYMQGGGTLVLNEIDGRRCSVLRGNVERLGVRNACVKNSSSENLAVVYKNYFDKILVDAPCSGEGMFKKEDAAVREWSVKNVLSCAARQSKILESVDKMLTAGGRLVYSTCTFAEEEDERQVETFMKLHPEYRLVKMKKLYPHEVNGEGHFCAVMEKTDGARAEDFRAKPVRNRPPEFVAAVKEFEKFSNETFTAVFGNITPFKYGAGVRLFSAVDGLPSDEWSGVCLGDFLNRRFVPNHALARCLKREQFEGVEADAETALRYLKGLTFDCSAKNGWRVVSYMGFPLGWCKVVNGIAKNHLPQGIRI